MNPFIEKIAVNLLKEINSKIDRVNRNDLLSLVNMYDDELEYYQNNVQTNLSIYIDILDKINYLLEWSDN